MLREHRVQMSAVPEGAAVGDQLTFCTLAGQYFARRAVGRVSGQADGRDGAGTGRLRGA